MIRYLVFLAAFLGFFAQAETFLNTEMNSSMIKLERAFSKGNFQAESLLSSARQMGVESWPSKVQLGLHNTLSKVGGGFISKDGFKLWIEDVNGEYDPAFAVKAYYVSSAVISDAGSDVYVVVYHFVGSFWPHEALTYGYYFLSSEGELIKAGTVYEEEIFETQVTPIRRGNGGGGW